jgi:hypothetical protein
MYFIILSLLLTPFTHAGTSFNSVRSILLDPTPKAVNAEAAKEIMVYKASNLPQYEVSLSKFVRNGVDLLAKSAQRTINEKTDIYPRVEKLLHPNGVCLMGEWIGTGDVGYSGYFSQGKRGLLVARASTATSATKVGEKRGFGLVLKLFPTMDPNKVVNTAQLFTVDVLAGTKRISFFGSELTNTPKLGFPDFGIAKMIPKISKALGSADKDLLYRPTYEIAEAGLSRGENAYYPSFIKIVAKGKATGEADFRDELNIKRHHPQGLIFEVYGNEMTSSFTGRGWEKLAVLHFYESIVSYGCDRQVHFPHPKSDR